MPPRRPALVAILATLPALLSHSVTLASAPVADPHAARISGVYFDGYLKGDPEPEEAIRIINTDADHVLDLSDFALTDRYGPRRPSRGHKKKKDKDAVESAAVDDSADDAPGEGGGV